MKPVLLVCFLSLVALSAAYEDPYARGCIYVEGQCVEGCPIGTHAYTTGCSPILPEVTCDEPNPVIQDSDTCDFTACYCDSPTVRDTKANKCVPRDQCPKKEEEEETS